MQNSNNMPSRLFFLSKGCRQVPPEECRGIIRWGHPDGYFLNAHGQRMADNLTPSHVLHCRNHPAPNLSNCGISCHRAMALAHYGPCPVFVDTKSGKKYKGLCHHLTGNLKDYRPANLLCWLTRAEHNEADRRQRALREAVDGGDLYGIPYERLRWLQDPRVTSREDFELELAKIQAQGFHHYDLDRQMEEELSNPIQFHLHND